MNFNTILIKIRFDWDRFGLKEKVTAANQLTDYVYDETGLLREILSKYSDRKNPDRSIAREYDDLDRLVKVTYDGRDVETYSYARRPTGMTTLDVSSRRAKTAL